MRAEDAVAADESTPRTRASRPKKAAATTAPVAKAVRKAAVPKAPVPKAPVPKAPVPKASARSASPLAVPTPTPTPTLTPLGSDSDAAIAPLVVTPLEQPVTGAPAAAVPGVRALVLGIAIFLATAAGLGTAALVESRGLRGVGSGSTRLSDRDDQALVAGAVAAVVVLLVAGFLAALRRSRARTMIASDPREVSPASTLE